MGLASPIAIVIGVGRAAENGILFNNVDAIESIVKVNTICFDKTGTLTTGEMKVKNVYTVNGMSANEMMKYVYSVEKFSNHPIAKSIVNYGIDNNINSGIKCKDFKNESGFGVSANVNGKLILIGNEDFINSRNISFSKVLFKPDRNYLFVSIDNEIAGVIEIEDKIKEEAPSVIKKLRSEGFEIFMISGDNENAAGKTRVPLT